MRVPWNEDMRVKFPATVQFMRLGYEYQSLKDADIHPETRIFLNRFVPAIQRINSDKNLTAEQILATIEEIHNIIKNNDMGKEFLSRLLDQTADIKLIDFDHPADNDFAIVDELTFGPEAKGSFRPDITILVNGIPLGFLEVKKPNNEGGIQKEFHRMLDERLQVPEFKKYFNMLQFVTFSNNMEYETDNDAAPAEEVRAGSFYSTPNGNRTFFSFFREENPKTTGFKEIYMDEVRYILKDNGYSPSYADTEEFQTNLQPSTPCNRFVTSFFDIPRMMYLLQYGFFYVDTIDEKTGQPVTQKHIMRYPQFFASQAILKRIDGGGKSGIIFHTQGSGKTELSAFSTRIIRDYYSERGITAKFYYVVDRLDLLIQVRDEMRNRGLNAIEVNSRADFEKELKRPLPKRGDLRSNGEIVVVNIQKFTDALPQVSNVYDAKIQRIFFVDEAHRSYKQTGQFFKNLMLVDDNAIYIAMTGTPLLSKKERSNLKFGDYIHKYFYDKSISDGYTLRIKKEEIDTTVRADIHRNLQFEKSQIDAKKDTMRTDEAYISSLGKFIETDFLNFRLVNADSTIGGMIVCSSNPQARKVKEWFDKNVSALETGLVISDEDAPRSDINKETQKAFRKTLKPDILIVHQMLTTGYDVPRLKKMYLLRNAKEHTLLQTISRVNRPYKNPKTGKVYQYGYIVDFVDIEKEYDRTIEMYLKEMEDDFNDDSDEHFSLAGLVIGPEDIDKKYHAYQAHMNTLVDTSVNLELFSQQLVKLDRDTLLAIRRDLNGIKDCRTEFLLSRAMTLAAQIDEDRIKKLLREVQNRIDFLNLTTKPIDLMTVVSNEEVVKIVYEFFKVKISIMDMSKLTRAFKNVTDIDGYEEFTNAVSDIQKEIRRNKNTGAEKIVSLEDLLKKIFVELEYIDLNNLSEVNGKLLKILEDLRCINEENERLAARYGGNYAFVKTYSDVAEMHPEFDKEDLAKLTDVAYAAVKDIEGSNILILHGRESFVNTVKKNTTTQLLKSGLYKKLNLKDWYADFLGETYSNMRIF